MSASLTTLRVPLASWLVVALLAAMGVVGLPAGSALAAGAPDIAMSKSAPASVLLGGQASYSLTVTNAAGPAAAFNVSFRDVLPVGVTYVAGSTSPVDAGDPTIVANQPGLGQTTLIWRNVGDVQMGGDLTLGFKATPSQALLPVASTFTNTATSYASSDPRQIAAFSATGVVVPTSYTSNASATGQPTTVTAIEIRKSEPSPELELVRGVHDHSTIYQLTVTNNTLVPTNAITVTDFLPAGLEFLGCGGVDNSAAAAVEYVGAPRLIAVPTLVADCLAPDAVDTVTNPAGRPAGVYTQVTWTVGNLAGAGVHTIAYRAGIPLRANTATFPGGTPTPGSLDQVANLDNNTGPSTAETGTEQAYTNHAQATGIYTGPVFAGGSTTVTSSDDLTVTSEDLAMQKSVAPGAFAGGGIATYTLRLQAGEYRDTAGIVITDHLPNGVCPLSTTTNFATLAPSECDPGPGFAPTGATIASATQNTDGSFDLVFAAVPSLAHDGVLTITYQGRMRATYTGPGGGVTTGSPTVAGDSFTNTVSLEGTSQALATNPPDPAADVLVHDASSATQTSGGPTIDKTIQARAVPMDCSTGAYVDTPTALSRPVFHLGDRVCFQLRVDFPTSNPTRNAVVTDFLPAGTTYEAGSATTGPGNTVPLGEISFNEAATVAGTADPTWTLGANDGTGVRFVQVGRVLVVRLSAIINTPAAGATPDVVGNLMKLRSENSPGHAVSLRDQVDLLITPAPPLQVQKGVASVNALPSPVNGANVDGTLVRQGDLVVFRVDLKNLGSAANGNDQTVRALRVLDALPTGVTCAAITLISDSGSCFDSGAVGRPSVTSATDSVLLWTLPQSDMIAAGASRPPLTYSMAIPTVASVSTIFTNTAGVSQYDADTDIEVSPGVARTTSYHPKTNIDTSVPVGQQNAPAAGDTSNVVIRNVTVAKTGTTGINETNNSLANQAVVGEQVTYTLTATVPAQSTVFNAAFSDPMPTGLTFISASATFTPDAAVPVPAALPAGVTQDSATGALTFAPTYSNNTATDQLFAVTIITSVSTLAGNASGAVRTNTASFTSTTLLAGGTAITARTATYAVTVVEPLPTLSKTDNTTGKIVVAGQVVTYTLTAGNTTGRPASKDTVVVDCVPAGLTFGAYGTPSQGSTVLDVPGTGSNGCAIGATRLQWDVGTLAGPATLTYTATVDPLSAGLTSYVNNATLTGSTLADGVNDATPSTNERVVTAAASDTLTVVGATLTKAATPTVPTVGERVTYTVTASIPANINFYDAAIIDALPGGIDATSVVRTSFTCTSSAGNCLPGGGAALTNAVGPAGTTLQGWSLGDVLSVPQVRTVTATYTAVVADIPANVRSLILTNTATVRWNSTNGTDPTSAGATFVRTSPGATASVVVQEPLLAVAKAVNDTTPEPGQIFTYTVTMSNSAAANVSAAFDAVVVDVVPNGVVVDIATITGGGTYDPGTRTITWTVNGPVAPGASVPFTYNARLAPSSGLTTAPLTNTVTVQSYNSLSGGGRAYTGPSRTATATPTFPRLTPTKSAVTAGQAFVGESFAWRLTLTNPGPAKDYGVDALDTLPANWTYDAGSATVSVAGGAATAVEPTVTSSSGVQTLRWTNLGDLTTGQAVLVNYTATPSVAATITPGAGLSVAHINSVSTTVEDATGATGNASGPYAAGPASASAGIASADVTITKSHAGSFTAGGTETWNVVVANAGPDPASGPFTVTDLLPTGTTVVSAGGTGWACSTAPISCTRTVPGDTLAASAAFPVITVLVNVAPDIVAGSTLTNHATVTAHTFDPTPVNNADDDTASVVTSADLKISKTHPAGLQPIAGQPFTWTVAVTNLGPSVSRAPIVVTDTLPAGTSFVSAAGTGWACSASGQVVTCTSAADLSLGEVAPQILVTANVAASAAGSISNGAHVSGATPDPAPGNDDATDTVTVDTSANLVLTKDRVGAFVAGATGTYRFRVENLGTSDAASPVRITDPLPSGLTATGVTTDVRGSWTCTGSTPLVCTLTGVLAAGDFATVEVKVQIPSSTVGNVHNTAAASSATSDPNPVNDSDDDDSAVTGEADLRLVKSHTGTAVAGEDIEFTLAVHNGGPSDTPGPLQVSDGLPAGMTFVSAGGTGWVCSSIADVVTCDRTAGLVSGADAPPITLTAHIDQSAGPATLANTATVQGPLTDPYPGNNSSTDTIAVVDRANVALAKSATSPTGAVRAGEEITYNLSVTNGGPSTADSLVVADSVPAGTTLVSAIGPGWTCSPGPDVVCTRPTLAVGSSDITLVVRVDSTVLDGASIVNAARVDTSTPGDLPGDNAGSVNVAVVAEADLRIVKTHRENPATAGLTVTFDLSVHNFGPSAAQHPLTLIEQLPVGLRFVSAGTGWTCAAGAVTGAGQTVTCQLDGTNALDAGIDAPTLTLVARVASDVTPGTFVNTAVVDSVTTDPVPGNNDASDPVVVRAVVDLTVAKTHTGPVRIGDPLTFSLVVRNAGPSAATNVVLVDTAPSGLTPSSSAASAGWTCVVNGQQVTCRLASPLAAGATAPPLSLTYAVTPSAYPSADNRAEVASDGTEAHPADNTSVDSVTVPPRVDLVVRKSHEGVLAVGSEATYVVEVGNAGPTNDPGPIRVTDTLPVGLRYVAATGDGWSCSAAGAAVTCLRADGLTLGASTTVRLRVDVLAAAYPSVNNTASVSTPSEDSDQTNNMATDSGTVRPLVDLAVAKRLTTAGGGLATWTISVVNRGPNAVDRPFTAVDQMPPGLDYVAVRGAGWICDYAAKRITCTHGEPLAVGGTATFTVDSRITAEAGTTVTNAVLVASAQDTNTANNAASADLDVTDTALSTGQARSGDWLARTGFDPASLLALAVLLMLAGGGALRIGKRRPTQK